MIEDFKQIIENACNIEMLLSNFVSKGGFIDSIEMFQQTWPTTTLGFSGCGGDSMTSAFTTVLRVYHNDGFEVKKEDGKYMNTKECYFVFFGGRFAYSVYEPTDCFFNDLKMRHMASCEKAKRLY